MGHFAKDHFSDRKVESNAFVTLIEIITVETKLMFLILFDNI